jgi:hypothetical protein
MHPTEHTDKKGFSDVPEVCFPFAADCMDQIRIVKIDLFRFLQFPQPAGAF